MAFDIDQSFTRQFESEVHEAYQRQGSKLRNGVRVKTGIVGKSTTFQKVGTGTATQKPRHGAIVPMNVEHAPVECILQDWYAGDWVDRLDELKIQHDERQVVANAGAYALGRKTDELITKALDNVSGTGINLSAVDIDSLTKWVTDLGARDVPIRAGEVFAAVSWPVWNKLLKLPQFVSADYVGEDLPYKVATMEAKLWLDVIWVPFSGLSGGSTARKCHIWHRTAVGHASGADVSTDITWHGDHAAHFVNSMMSQGAVLIDANGVETRNVNEGA